MGYQINRLREELQKRNIDFKYERHTGILDFEIITIPFPDDPKYEAKVNSRIDIDKSNSTLELVGFGLRVTEAKEKVAYDLDYKQVLDRITYCLDNQTLVYDN